MSERVTDAIRPIRVAAVIVTVWLIVALFFSWEQHRLAIGRGQQDIFSARLFGVTAAMLIWALFTPPLLYVGERFPVRGPNRLRNTLYVAMFAAAIALVRAFTDVILGLVIVEHLITTTAVFHKYFLFALIVIGIANFTSLEREEAARRHQEVRGEAEAAEVLLRQLQADLNPHFLFNTLNDVAMLLHSDPAAAKEMLRKLRDFLSRAVATEHDREVRLADELEFVSRYFDLQRMRFGNKLLTTVDVVHPRLYDAAVPPLLLQPLVENAIAHGVGRGRDGGSVAVTVDEEQTGSHAWLRIRIRDSGPGCSQETVFGKARVGVSNTLARLESLYGTRQRLTYERENGGFVACVLIPLRVVQP